MLVCKPVPSLTMLGQTWQQTLFRKISYCLVSVSLAWEFCLSIYLTETNKNEYPFYKLAHLALNQHSPNKFGGFPMAFFLELDNFGYVCGNSKLAEKYSLGTLKRIQVKFGEQLQLK